MEFTTLRNGVTIPMVGYGVFQIPEDETARCVREAIEAGYRHIDTAQSYFNERQVGEGIRESSIDRKDLFVTTKVWISHYGDGKTRESVEDSLRKLGTDYLDLVLLHQPFNDRYGAWRDLERLYDEGKIRAIGVSNFGLDQLNDLGAFNDVAPMVNQVETNPLNQQIETHDWMAAHNVAQEAWAPFGEGRNNLFHNELLAQIGEAHGKSVAQVILRWLTQRGIVALAKSTHKDRMEQNLDIFDFTLTDDEMADIATLDTKTSLFFDHRDPETVEMFVRMVKAREGRA
ncbi:aldo/keto reductase [Bifidobacterium pseudolongum]|uniref:aldo/keto reductase n=1 Tax=Bifidobacterium pseudolongum TaxID=1694 RepID=UPI00101F3D36|nr:aldo/keto reductase [Bifidobacterium pseudolongum]RYQ64019.1 2,5-diketo-D-gluconic acid reductase [Bifidobacterium pseudolongum subsp. globosum]